MADKRLTLEAGRGQYTLRLSADDVFLTWAGSESGFYRFTAETGRQAVHVGEKWYRYQKGIEAIMEWIDEYNTAEATCMP